MFKLLCPLCFSSCPSTLAWPASTLIRLSLHHSLSPSPLSIPTILKLIENDKQSILLVWSYYSIICVKLCTLCNTVIITQTCSNSNISLFLCRISRQRSMPIMISIRVWTGISPRWSSPWGRLRRQCFCSTDWTTWTSAGATSRPNLLTYGQSHNTKQHIFANIIRSLL